MNARVRCVTTCYIDGCLYEADREYTLMLPKEHGHWEHFDVLEDMDVKKGKGKGKDAPADASASE